MPTFGPPDARCDVFTYKEGLLSAVGHDLRLAVGRFEVRVEGGAVEATFDAGSVAVACAVRDGVDQPDTLSDRDRRTIDGYVREDVLHSRRYPKIVFRSTSIAPDDDGDEDDAFVVAGELSLHGRTREIEVPVRLRGDRWEARVRLHQPDFGIAPFKAMLGALRIQPDVEVALSIPASGVALG